MELELIKAPKLNGEPEAYVDQLLKWMSEKGGSNYDESVTQFEHALQSGALARERGNPLTLVVAALLHDVGHLLADEHNGHEEFLFTNLKHENIGARWLARAFRVEVTEPIRLHVDAKRYLCTVDADYYDRLSASSKRSFAVQGGRMSEDEIRRFRNEPYLEQALEVRKIDDEAKVSSAIVTNAATYRPLLLAAMR